MEKPKQPTEEEIKEIRKGKQTKGIIKK